MVVLIMNKLFIPAILAATVMIAAAFAIMPVEKASTVHTTILSGVTKNCIDILTALNGTDNGINVGSTAQAIAAHCT